MSIDILDIMEINLGGRGWSLWARHAGIQGAAPTASDCSIYQHCTYIQIGTLLPVQYVPAGTFQRSEHTRRAKLSTLPVAQRQLRPEVPGIFDKHQQSFYSGYFSISVGGACTHLPVIVAFNSSGGWRTFDFFCWHKH
jgi:hypothetical protein